MRCRVPSDWSIGRFWMTIDELRPRHGARPFHPFTLRLTDGRALAVKSPEFLAQSRGGRVLYLATPGGLAISDLLMVVSISMDERGGGGRGGRGGRRRAS